MEKVSMDSEQKTLINELKQGKELASQLRNHLNPSSSLETRSSLIEKILVSYEKALKLLNWEAVFAETKPAAATLLESQLHSMNANNSPRSDVSDQDCEKQVFKKRKTQPRWIERVKVCHGSGLEGPLDDGYSWRKYGQKDILGANYPRGYYRCTHRHSQGCLATKQVQKSDNDPTIFEVTYRGRHTCIQASHLGKASPLPKGSGQKLSVAEKPKPIKTAPFTSGHDEFKVKKEELDAKEEKSIFPSFSFKFSSIGNEDDGNNLFADSIMENSFLGSLSPPFISPATSESNYFSLSPCDMNNFGIGHAVRTPESELTEIISASTSVTNSPIADLDISINVDFDTNFLDDNPELFA